MKWNGMMYMQCVITWKRQFAKRESSPGSSDSKESACNVGDLGSVPGLGRSPGGGHGIPLQYSSLENPHGQRRSLVGHSPWGCKESDRTERLSTRKDPISVYQRRHTYTCAKNEAVDTKMLSWLSLGSWKWGWFSLFFCLPCCMFVSEFQTLKLYYNGNKKNS